MLFSPLSGAAGEIGGFDQVLELQGISFYVTSTNQGSINQLEIVPAGLEIDNTIIKREIDGTVTAVEVADLNGDGSPEIYLPPLMGDKGNSRGYMGHDEFAVVETKLARRFHVYAKGDVHAKPAGGTRQLQYKLNQGGIANEYFGFDREQNFRTFDVLTTGKVIPEISAAFDIYWNSGWVFPITAIDRQHVDEDDLVRLRKNLRSNAAMLDEWLASADTDHQHRPEGWAEVARTLIQGDARLLQDDPHFEGETPPVQAAEQIKKIFSKASKEVMNITAYMGPSDDLLQLVRELSDRGVYIRVLTNSLASNNHVAAHTAYRYRQFDPVMRKNNF